MYLQQRNYDIALSGKLFFQHSTQFQETLAVRGTEQTWVNAPEEEAVLYRELLLINREFKNIHPSVVFFFWSRRLSNQLYGVRR